MFIDLSDMPFTGKIILPYIDIVLLFHNTSRAFETVGFDT